MLKPTMIAAIVFALSHLGLATHAYTCEWYADAVESVYQCGPKGYPLHYAKKYCERIGAISDLSPEGRDWYHATRDCLQKALIPTLVTPLADCAELREYAYRTHRECYVRNGGVSVCELSHADLARIARALEPRTLLSPKSLLVMLGIARDCRLQRQAKSATIARE